MRQLLALHIPLADLLDDCRAIVRSNTVRVLLTLALSLALQSFMPSNDAGQLAEAILSGLDWFLIAAAMYFRARARGPIHVGRARRARAQARTPQQ